MRARRQHVEPLVDELCRLSPEFEAMWRDNDVRTHGEGVKHIRHPLLGLIAFEYSAFAVDGRPDLTMVVYNPATPADAQRISSLCQEGGRPGIWQRGAMLEACHPANES